MSRIIFALLLFAIPFIKADFVDAGAPQKDYDRAGSGEGMPAYPGQTTGNVDIDKCIQSIQNLKPVFNKMIIDAQFRPTHEKMVRNFKVLAVQLQETSGTCGINFGVATATAIPENCDNDVKIITGLVQGLNNDDNYFMIMTKLMALGQALPQAIADCSE